MLFLKDRLVTFLCSRLANLFPNSKAVPSLPATARILVIKPCCLGGHAPCNPSPCRTAGALPCRYHHTRHQPLGSTRRGGQPSPKQYRDVGLSRTGRHPELVGLLPTRTPPERGTLPRCGGIGPVTASGYGAQASGYPYQSGVRQRRPRLSAHASRVHHAAAPRSLPLPLRCDDVDWTTRRRVTALQAQPRRPALGKLRACGKRGVGLPFTPAAA